MTAAGKQNQKCLLVAFEGEGAFYTALFLQHITQNRLKHGAP